MISGHEAYFVRLGVLVSGKGTNLQALIEAAKGGAFKAKVAVVLSNRFGVPALERAREAKIPFQVLDPVKFASREAYDEALVAELRKHAVDMIVLAGFMRVLTEVFLKQFPERVLNLHPALLPDDPIKDEVRLPDGTTSKVFRGLNVIQDALNAGVKWTGCTVHLATPSLDRGPVVKRQPVPILSGDTLESLHARIRGVEHQLLPQAVAEWAERILSS